MAPQREVPPSRSSDDRREQRPILRPSLTSQPRLSSSLRHATTPQLSPSPPAEENTPTRAARIESPASVKTVIPHDTTPTATSHPAIQSYDFPKPIYDPTIIQPSPQHQPFMDLSPTVTPSVTHPHPHIMERKQSTANTSRASVPFMSSQGQDYQPSHDQYSQSADLQYPPPNLYDVVLKLNADPRLHAWWASVADVLKESYLGERATLAVPVDATDIENVPWVLRAAYDDSGLKIPIQPSQHKRRVPSDSKIVSAMGPVRSLSATRGRGPLRPSLRGRHSYAGYETPSSQSHLGSTRLQPDDFSPHGGSTSSRKAHFDEAKPPSSQSSVPDSVSEPAMEPDGSSESSTEMRSAVFTNLRPLNSEQESLVESSHISRVLAQRKTVVLTRNYAIDHDGPVREDPLDGEHMDKSRQSHFKNGSSIDDRTAKGRPLQPKPTPPSHAYLSSHSKYLKMTRYEEVEQIPPSPWSNSPAPSPAVQAEPDENPFFISANVEESSFSPKQAAHDYAHTGAVEVSRLRKALSKVSRSTNHYLGHWR